MNLLFIFSLIIPILSISLLIINFAHNSTLINPYQRVQSYYINNSKDWLNPFMYKDLINKKIFRNIRVQRNPFNPNLLTLEIIGYGGIYHLSQNKSTGTIDLLGFIPTFGFWERLNYRLSFHIWKFSHEWRILESFISSSYQNYHGLNPEIISLVKKIKIYKIIENTIIILFFYLLTFSLLFIPR